MGRMICPLQIVCFDFDSRLYIQRSEVRHSFPMGRIVLTEDDVRFIRSEFNKKTYDARGAYLQGVLVFARSFNVSRKTIQDVIHFRTWKKVPTRSVIELEEDPGLTLSVLELEKLDPFDGICLD